ncbi:hypothetical protein [Wolbachia endosymbiont of Cylisticus convexus]|uniref:hypothetical protein n=1 Tax=Wolbachia endosymbiont of Cylisticus convexus TaxID=118728 RepID=UPI0015D0892F|nr:hypothetical protein [Wolbachia endosymbiont of Cylisticus convexus]
MIGDSFAFFLFSKFLNVYIESVIPVLDTGIQQIYCKQDNIFDQKTGSQWALLHSTSCGGGLRQIHVTISNLAMPISVNLLSK